LYCVIQEIPLKKPNKHGAYKKLEVYSFAVNGTPKYSYKYAGERFGRDTLKAYKISIHESRRVNGVVTKKQFSVTTADYYSLAEFSIWDCMIDTKVSAVAKKLNTDAESLYTLIQAKAEPLQMRIIAEFKETDEYKVKEKNENIIAEYRKNKNNFAETYGCDAEEYDYCYDIFGNLMNSDYFDKVINDYQKRCSYQRKSRSNYSGGNYNWDNFSSYLNISSGNYTEDEKILLKKFYRSLSKEYHPDKPSGDTAAMKLVNRLKDSWGI